MAKVLPALDSMVRCLYTIVLGVLILIGSSMLGIAWAHVYYRYVLNNSLTWSEELLKILLVWFCLLSATIIAAQRGHVSIVVFKEMMPARVAKALTFIAQALMFAASLGVLAIGVNFVMSAGTRLTPALRMPYRYAYAAIPVSFAIISLYEFRNVAADFVKGPKLAVDVQE